MLERLKDTPIRAPLKKDLAGDPPRGGNLFKIAAAVRGFSYPLPRNQRLSNSQGKARCKFAKVERNLQKDTRGFRRRTKAQTGESRSWPAKEAPSTGLSQHGQARFDAGENVP